MKRHTHATLLCLTLLPASASAEEWFRHFRIGMTFGVNISTDFKTVGTFPVTGSQPGPDPSAGNADRFYDDGFVRIDETSNAPINGAGASVTTFWGYQNAEQLNGTQLSFRSSSAFTGSGVNRVQDAPHLGFDMAYGSSIVKWPHVAIGAEFGFNLTSIATKDLQPLNANINQIIDTYDAPGITVPGAPYSGPFTTPGPPFNAQVINSIPTSRSIVNTPGLVTGERQLEAIFYQLRLGPLIRWQVHPRWVLNGSFGGAFGLLDGNYEFNERVGLGAGSFTFNRGEFGSLEIVYGGYAGAIMTYDSGHNWEAYFGTHFISMTDAKFAQSGREANVNLGAALYLSVGMHWTF